MANPANADGKDLQIRSLERRLALRAGIACATALATMPSSALAGALAQNSGREVSFVNLHTGEKLRAEYWHNGKYVPDALHAVSVVLRDHCNNKVHPIDPHLLDLANLLRNNLRNPAPLQVVSGYRSPETNAAMHQNSSGVAAHSLHMEGRAIDIRLPGTHLPALRQAALSLNLGGVGYYPSDDFVHVDTGKIRRWVG